MDDRPARVCTSTQWSRGLLARCPATDDRRSVIVRLADAGVALADRAAEIHAQAEHEALTGRFSAAEQAALLRALSQMGG